MNRKGVATIMMLIGLLLVIVSVVIIAATMINNQVVLDSSTLVAIDFGLTTNAMLSAPEDILMAYSAKGNKLELEAGEIALTAVQTVNIPTVDIPGVDTDVPIPTTETVTYPDNDKAIIDDITQVGGMNYRKVHALKNPSCFVVP